MPERAHRLNPAVSRALYPDGRSDVSQKIQGGSEMRNDLAGEEEKKDYLKSQLALIKDPRERQIFKNAIRKITVAAEIRIQQLQAELDRAREELLQERRWRLHAEETLEKREPLLTERVKEISCLYSIVSLMADPGYPSEKQRIQDIVKLIPTGWHSPEDACARITLWGREFQTDNFRDTPWQQTSPILVTGETAGVLTVGYLREKPVQEEGPFLLEERTLIDVMAGLIGAIIGPKLALDNPT
jgi:hypothetical protein